MEMEDIYFKSKRKKEIKKEVAAMSRKKKQKVFEYLGYRSIPPFSLEAMKYVHEKWKMPKNSVIIASFPHTDTSWCSEIVNQIFYGGYVNISSFLESVPEEFFNLEMGSKGKFEIYGKLPLPNPVFTTHLAEGIINHEDVKNSNGKVIYVMRNPKDQAVSWFHFSKKLPDSLRKELGETWDIFYDNYVNGRHPNCTKLGEFYPDSFHEWLKHKNDDNFHLLVYEDMKRDLPEQIRRIAAFWEYELPDSLVQSIAEACSIESKKEEAEGDENGNLDTDKGEVGEWKEQFTAAQSELMDKIVEEKLAGTGIEFTYSL